MCSPNQFATVRPWISQEIRLFSLVSFLLTRGWGPFVFLTPRLETGVPFDDSFKEAIRPLDYRSFSSYIKNVCCNKGGDRGSEKFLSLQIFRRR